MTASDGDLIARVLSQDDRDAFRHLVERHQSAVRRYLRYLAGGNETWADELAQDTFVDAYRNLAQFRGGSRFETWLFGIARNHMRNAARRQQVRREASAAIPVPEVASPHTTTSDLRHDLAIALKTLSPEEKLALQLGYEQGYTHAEIAAATQWPLGTAKTHLARGKEKLRQLLAAWNTQT